MGRFTFSHNIFCKTGNSAEAYPGRPERFGDNRRLKNFIRIIPLLVIAVSLKAQPAKGRTAPEIILPDATGKSIPLSGLRGKTVLVEFWASWCGPCRRNNPFLSKLYHRYQSRGFEIYGISLDTEKAQWLQAIREDKIDWLQVIDPAGVVAEKWKVVYIPASILLDKTGKVIVINPDERKLEKELKHQMP